MEWFSILHDPLVFWILWAFTALRLTHIHMAKWQSLGFRLDRFRVFLPTKQGKEYLWNTLVWYKVLLLLAIPVLVILGNFEHVFVWLIWGLLLWQAVLCVIELFQKSFVYPQYTVQTVGVMVLQIVLEMSLLVSYSVPEMFLYVEVLRPVTMSLIILSMKPLQWIGEQFLLNHIAKAREENPQITVIAVVGSAGKTTTAMYINALLQSDKRVYISKEISYTWRALKELLQVFRRGGGYDVIIVEIHGYKKMEVERLGKVLRPDIAVVTTMNERQNVITGTVEGTKEVVLGILRHVPAHRGLVILNGDLRYPTFSMMSVYARQAVYSLVSSEADCFVEILEVRDTGSSFVVKLWEELVPIELSVAGRHHISNFVAAMACAAKLGIESVHMQMVASQIQPSPKKLAGCKGYAGAYILDDTYGANPMGVHHALEVLSLQDGKRKVILLAGLEELGEATENIHRSIGEYVGRVVDECIFYDTLGIEEALREGIQESGRYGTHVQVFTDPKSLKDYVIQHIFEGDVVLMEHNIPESTRSFLTKI